MILAHLPSGYILAHALPARLWVMPAVLLGAVFPDLDLFWFYVIDDRAFHHHRYWVHVPGFWLLIAAVLLPLIARIAANCFWPAVGFLFGVALHIFLDGLAGGIMWFWPFSDQLFTLVNVPAVYSNWVVSFLLHWTILIEICIIGIAAVLFVRARRK